jgi:aminobenzoyl-glutamate utilization protein B
MDVDLDESVADPFGEGDVMPGSTDVADVSWQCPTVEFSTASRVLGTPGHSWQATAFSGVSVGDKSLLFASKVIACSVIDLLSDPDLLLKAHGEFRSRLQGRVYRSPLSADAKPPLDAWKK